MKKIPILFSGPMVRAILAGRKTQTRRAIKPQPDEDGLCRDLSRDEKLFDSSGREYKCPFGFPDDLLWVRETFAMATGSSVLPDTPVYRADGEGLPILAHKWKPSIFMPRSISRLTLLVKEITVERVQDISDRGPSNDCTDEGVFHCGLNLPDDWRERGYHSIEKCAFRDLWDSINKKRGFGWDNNPWVWVVEFGVICRNVEEV
ncbi:MAG: hypothetical protein DRH10_00630 [Deltaproteobacteria bacterium]|nr:MAG: hypothetical protein DRH10_00630 [Deltaproteobacteria bacterium]